MNLMHSMILKKKNSFFYKDAFKNLKKNTQKCSKIHYIENIILTKIIIIYFINVHDYFILIVDVS